MGFFPTFVLSAHMWLGCRPWCPMACTGPTLPDSMILCSFVVTAKRRGANRIQLSHAALRAR
eukprot:15363607-Alexandrium_andersonii.AAC.1